MESGNYIINYIDQCSFFIKTSIIEIKNSPNFIPISEIIKYDIQNKEKIGISFNNENNINNIQKISF